jgi:hypothetical protein
MSVEGRRLVRFPEGIGSWRETCEMGQTIQDAGLLNVA